jgi:hypothetical protein
VHSAGLATAAIKGGQPALPEPAAEVAIGEALVGIFDSYKDKLVDARQLNT